MTVLQPQIGPIRPPRPSPLSQPFWDGCAQGELRFQRCNTCGQATHTPAYLCAHCTSTDLTWEASGGNGVIYSWTAVWRPQTPAFEVPYVPIIVDMNEEWQILSNLIGCALDAVSIGMSVEVDFRQIEGGWTLPYFRPGSVNYPSA